jgi:hypothetical protein
MLADVAVATTRRVLERRHRTSGRVLGPASAGLRRLMIDALILPRMHVRDWSFAWHRCICVPDYTAAVTMR